jgi:cyclopropane-fatty-acyl-phospholipid synthase
VAVSNSRDQGAFIREQAAEHGLTNLTVETADVNAYAPGGSFDRVVSVEMFEHVKNYGELLRRIAGWLAPDGRLFVHMFVHRELAYHYESEGPDDWMARHFFTGGTMPSADLLRHFEDDLLIEHEWLVPGTHYQRTCEAWLARMDARREAVRPILAATYGDDQVTRWWVRWRVFFMACAELFGFAGGREWMVGHFLLRPRDAMADSTR